MAYKKQGNSRDDKSQNSFNKTGRSSSGRRPAASRSTSEGSFGEGGFKRRSSADAAGSQKKAATDKPFSRSSASKAPAENSYRSRTANNASFTGRKPESSRNQADAKPLSSQNPERKSARFGKVSGLTGQPSGRFGAGKSFKSGNSEGRPYQKDFTAKPKRYVKNNEQDDFTNKKPVMRSRSKAAAPASKDKGLIRLNRYIANAGICSRRKADELIEAGVVSVNGEVVSELGTKIDPQKDVIRYNGETLKREKMVYVLLNKPKDYITTTDDPQERRTVMQLVDKASRERIYPVGRLDRNTTGLLLMTNDGELAEKLSHPRNSVTKIYNIELDKSLTQGDFNKIAFGLELEDGLIKPDQISYVTGGSKREVGIQIHSGKNRIVRRIFEHLGYDVVKLDRVIYANLTKKDLTRGRWRYLEEKEVIQLKHLMK